MDKDRDGHYTGSAIVDHEQSILKEIKNNLDDDTPRLILADWYSERNDPRGDFIRTQCELARMDWDDPRYEELQTLQESLLSKHRAKWLKSLPKLDGVAWGSSDMATSHSLWWESRTYFRRGFVELVTYKDYAAYSKNAQAIAEYGFVTHPQFLKLNLKALETLASFPALRGTSHFQWDFDAEDLRRFVAREKLQSITLNECSLHNGGLLRLMNIEFPSLKVLDLAYNRLQFTQVDFSNWKSLLNIQWLNLGGNNMGVRGWGGATDMSLQSTEKLTKLPFQNLHALRLNSSQLTTKQITELCRSNHLKRLTELDLSTNDLTDDSILELAKGNFPTLRHLALGTNELTNAGSIALAEYPSFRTLRRLRIQDNSIGDEGIEAIAQSPHLSNLTHLNIPRLKFGLGGINALIRSTTLNSIRYLNIGDIELDAKTLKDLQRRYPKAIVRKPYH